MKRILKVSILIVLSILGGFNYGYFVHRNKIFPYDVIRKTYLRNMYQNSMQWSIGVFAGNSPFELTDPVEIDNPVITFRDINDVSAAFVADPFMIIMDEEYFIFFEVLNLDTNSGDIGYAVSNNGINWEYKKIILDEEFHLSYPLVFEWGGSIYMIPESSEALSVRLYKANTFPEEWEYIGNLLSGSEFVDPTVFFYNDVWYMFTSNRENDTLNLFFSNSLISGWQPHLMNPIISDNKHIARPAGRIFKHDNRLFRLAQDDYPYYGMQVFAVEITELSPEVYEEDTEAAIPIVTMSNKGWNAAGMHHVDLHNLNGKWIAYVDGIKRRTGTK